MVAFSKFSGFNLLSISEFCSEFRKLFPFSIFIHQFRKIMFQKKTGVQNMFLYSIFVHQFKKIVWFQKIFWNFKTYDERFKNVRVVTIVPNFKRCTILHVSF